MEIVFERIDPNARIPEYAHKGDAGMDLCSVDECELSPGEIKLVRTGLRARLPRGAELQVRPRSGLSLKHGVTVLNSPGTIDEGYRGEIGVILINHGREAYKIEIGARIAQLVLKPVYTAAAVEGPVSEETERGAGGFGSTGMDAPS